MTLTLLQGLVTVVCLDLMRRRGWIEYDPFNWKLVVSVSAACTLLTMPAH